MRALPEWLRLPAAALAGAAHAMSFAPWHLPWLQVLSLAALFALALWADTPNRAAASGFAFGLGWFGVGIHWLQVALAGPAAMEPALAAAATAALVGLLALFPLLAMAIGHALAPGRPRRRLLISLPLAWTLMEWARSWILSGFPWLSPGYAHTDGPLAGWAPVVGVTGLNGLAAVCAGLLVLATLPAIWRHRLLAATALVGIGTAGTWLGTIAWTEPSGAAMPVRLVQGSLPQTEKFQDSGERSASHYLALASGPAAELTVLPETLFPKPIQSLDPLIVARLHEAAASSGGTLLFGAFVASDAEGRQVTNSVLALPAGGDVQRTQRYDKRRLLPFAEFAPAGFRWFIDLMHMPMGDQAAGRARPEALQAGSARLGVLICYELAFPALARTYFERSEGPGLLINVSNFAWFRGTRAADQHLQIGRMRALEFGRPLLLASTMGPTAIVAPTGRVVAVLPFERHAALDGMVSSHSGTTPYGRAGDLPTWIACALALVTQWISVRRRPRP